MSAAIAVDRAKTRPAVICADCSGVGASLSSSMSVSGVGLVGLHLQAYTGGRRFQDEQNGDDPARAVGHRPGAQCGESNRSVHGAQIGAKAGVRA